MQWHSNGVLYPLWSSLWTKPNFLAAATLTAGATVSFENYQTPSNATYPNGQLIGNFTVVIPKGL